MAVTASTLPENIARLRDYCAGFVCLKRRIGTLECSTVEAKALEAFRYGIDGLMFEINDVASKSPGVRIGRVLSFRVGDGYAYYMIDAVKARTVHVLHIPTGNAWTAEDIVSPRGTLALHVATNVLRRNDDARRSA